MRLVLPRSPRGEHSNLARHLPNLPRIALADTVTPSPDEAQGQQVRRLPQVRACRAGQRWSARELRPEQVRPSRPPGSVGDIVRERQPIIGRFENKCVEEWIS